VEDADAQRPLVAFTDGREVGARCAEARDDPLRVLEEELARPGQATAPAPGPRSTSRLSTRRSSVATWWLIVDCV
jgi:hypothetical protein